MKKRWKTNSKKTRQQFARTANQTRAANLKGTAVRGGIHL